MMYCCEDGCISCDDDVLLWRWMYIMLIDVLAMDMHVCCVWKLVSANGLWIGIHREYVVSASYRWHERGVLPQWPRIHRMWQTCHLHVNGYIHVDSCCVILLCFGCWFGYILLSISMSHTLLVSLYGFPDSRGCRGGPLPVNVWGVQLVSCEFWTCCQLSTFNDL